MSPLEALILGCIQGLTEFLPVSSSGHLLLARWLFGLEGGFIGFAVAAHLGSLAAVLVFVRRDISAIIRGLEVKSVLRLVLASVPAALAGLLIKESFVPVGGWQLGAAFAGTALLCASMPEGGERRWRSIGVGALLYVGAFQAAALVPGISRSGSTIWAALTRGLKSSEALSFSFLLAAVAIAGASLLEAKEIATLLCRHPASSALLLAASFLSSLFALSILRLAVVRLKMWFFTPYLLGLAVLSAVLIK